MKLGLVRNIANSRIAELQIAKHENSGILKLKNFEEKNVQNHSIT